MAFAAEQRIVRQRLVAQWTSTPIDWSAFGGDAAPFVPPAPQVGSPAAAAWIRPALFVVRGERVSLGLTARRRTAGQLVIQVFTPQGAGHKPAATLAASLCTLFRDVQVEGMTFLEPTPRPIGPEAQGAWYQLNVEIPFRRDEIA